jgi:hypothetical protein
MRYDRVGSEVGRSVAALEGLELEQTRCTGVATGHGVVLLEWSLIVRVAGGSRVAFRSLLSSPTGFIKGSDPSGGKRASAFEKK